MSLSEKLRTGLLPNSTLTLACYQFTVVLIGKGRGRYTFCSDTDNDPTFYSQRSPMRPRINATCEVHVLSFSFKIFQLRWKYHFMNRILWNLSCLGLFEVVRTNLTHYWLNGPQSQLKGNELSATLHRRFFPGWSIHSPHHWQDGPRESQ